VIVVNIKEVKDGIKGITEVGLHAESFFDLMKVDYRLVYIYFGVDPVMEIIGSALSVTLEKSGFARENVSDAEEIDFFIESTIHVNIEILLDLIYYPKLWQLLHEN